MNLTSAAVNNIPQEGEGLLRTQLQHRRLCEAAQQFEGMLLQELLKPMRERGFGSDEEDRENGVCQVGDTLSSYGTEALATAIARHGGLGIANNVVQQVEGERVARNLGKS